MVLVLVADGAELASWDVGAHHSPDLSVVDRLARLHLAARRQGWTLLVREPSPALVELIELTGVPLALEPGR